MTVYPLDIAIIVWGFAGTLIIKRLLLLLASGKSSQSAVVVTAIALGLVPLFILRINIAEYSALGVMAAGVIVFWFAILAIRSCKVT